MNNNCQLVTCAGNAPEPDVSERLCVADAQCVPGGQGGPFTCECSPGFSGDGQDFCRNDNDCQYNDQGNEFWMEVSY